MKRPIAPIAMPDIAPGAAATGMPRPEFVAPTELRVDEAYQRDLSKRSIKLIRRIVAGWDWRRFKPPIVVKTDDGYDVIDGQHTAIAAASHPDVKVIPVMIVEAAEDKARAAAFLGHNRDRLQVTVIQMHNAAVVAGDEDALTIEQVTARAGIRVLRHPPSQGRFEPGDTMAIAAIGALISRFGALRARVILQVLADARCAPVRAEAIRAAAMLMGDAEYKDSVKAEDLTIRVRSMGEEAYREARVFAVAHRVPAWRALGITWFKGMRRGRRAA